MSFFNIVFLIKEKITYNVHSIKSSKNTEISSFVNCIFLPKLLRMVVTINLVSSKALSYGSFCKLKIKANVLEVRFSKTLCSYFVV